MKCRFIPMAGFPRRRFQILTIIGLVLFLIITARPGIAGQVRPSLLAGAWYPESADELSKSVRGMIDRADPEAVSGHLIALAVPHAGHIYSGSVAAFAFKLLADKDYDTVILIGPSHRYSFSGAAVDIRDYETPLGRVTINRDLSDDLIKKGRGFITTMDAAREQEHCLEIELPFLQTVLPHARIVPIIIGSQDEKTCHDLAGLLAAEISGQNVLLLASTDLSHYHTGKEARILDGRLLKDVSSFEPDRLYRDLHSGKIEACGGGPLTVVMMAARSLGADQARVLKYAHSGEVTGDNSRVVGYMAAVFTQSDSSVAHHAAGSNLSDSQIRLLEMARDSIRSALDDKEFTPPSGLPDELRAHRGAFVTLKKDGQLRGCIGRIISDRPLAETVCDMAVQAAFHDPRFAPLTADEYNDLEMEISVLSPVEPVTDLQSIQVGKHGLIMVKGYYQGLLLPQVPLEFGWNRLEFLNQTCRKAGLPPECWKDGAKVYAFTADVFGEKETSAHEVQ